jgi:hypothetical protein
MAKIPIVLSTACVKVEFDGPTKYRGACWIATNVNTTKRIMQLCNPELHASVDAANVAGELLDTKRMYSSSIAGGGWLFMAMKKKSPRKKYILRFHGKLIGALGNPYGIVMHVHARSEKAARLRLYDVYEHVCGEVDIQLA